MAPCNPELIVGMFDVLTFFPQALLSAQCRSEDVPLDKVQEFLATQKI